MKFKLALAFAAFVGFLAKGASVALSGALVTYNAAVDAEHASKEKAVVVGRTKVVAEHSAKCTEYSFKLAQLDAARAAVIASRDSLGGSLQAVNDKVFPHAG
jgi:hypothetical protein